MATNVKLKDAFDVESKHGSFFTGGNVEWTEENILICQKEESLQLLDIGTGTVKLTIGEGEDEDHDIINTFTSNITSIVTSHKSGLLKLWNYDGVMEKVWKSIHKGPIAKLQLNSGGNLASGGSDGIIRMWNLQHQTCTLSLRGLQGVVSVMQFHPSENVLFGAGDDLKIHSWSLDKGDIIRDYTGHFSKITSITFDVANDYMISSGRDKVIILWSVENGNAVKTLPVFESIESVVMLPQKFKLPGLKCNESTFVATAGEKGIIRVWDLIKSKEIYSQTNSLVPKAKEEGGLSITKLLYNPKIKAFGVVTTEHNIILHELKTFKCIKQFVGFTDEILDITFIGKDDSHLAVATNSADIKLYDMSNMNCQLLQGHTDIVLSLAKSPIDCTLLLSCGKDNTVRLWKMDNDIMTCVSIGTKHTESVGSVAFSQMTADFAVSVSEDRCIKVWEIPKKFGDNEPLECIRTEVAHEKDINHVTISPNDKIIATASQDKVAKLWSNSLELLGALRGHKRGIWCVRFSPVDQVVITSSADCTVKLWSITNLTCLKTLQGHDSSVLKTEFLSNGMQILTAGADGLLKVFSVKTSECVTTLDQHEGKVWALAVQSDESTIVSGGSDSLLVKWKDVTLEKRQQKIEEEEKETLQEQQLSNLLQNKDYLKALELALVLNRPSQTLKIIKNIIQSDDAGLEDTVHRLSDEQKNLLLQCASSWNTNSRHCQPAQQIINILIHEMQKGSFKPTNLSYTLESVLPYTERHFKRLTELLQDLQFLTYTINCMQPHAKK